MFKDFSCLGMVNNNIIFDVSSMCQLKCPICPTSNGTNKNGVIGWGYLKFKNFKDFIDRNPSMLKLAIGVKYSLILS
jgi:hypothetical protein